MLTYISLTYPITWLLFALFTVSNSRPRREKRWIWTVVKFVAKFLVKSCWQCYRCVLGKDGCSWKTCCKWTWSNVLWTRM